MEEKKKVFKTQAGHNVQSLDRVGDAEEGCWPSTVHKLGKVKRAGRNDKSTNLAFLWPKSC